MNDRLSCSTALGESLPAPHLLEIVTRHTGATICVVDNDLSILYANEAYANWFNARPKELLGRTLTSLYSDAARAQFRPHIDRALAGHEVTYQRQICNAEGQEVWFSISLHPWLDEEGQVGGLVNSALEVHELKVTTEALRSANQKLFSHMENSPLAVVELDARLGLVHCSSRATEWFGWHHASHQGESLLGLVGEDARVGALRKGLHRLLSGTERQNRVEASFIRPDGSVQHCMWFNSALINLRGETQFIDRLMQAFATPFALPDTDGVRVTLGVSIGVAAHPPLPALVDELLTRADHAMYEAKRGGKGCVHYAVPAPV
eukprot:gene9589-9400_t